MEGVGGLTLIKSPPPADSSPLTLTTKTTASSDIEVAAVCLL